MDEELKKIRELLKNYEWDCEDIYSKWKDYFIDDLLYDESTPYQCFNNARCGLEIAIARDKEET